MSDFKLPEGARVVYQDGDGVTEGSVFYELGRTSHGKAQAYREQLAQGGEVHVVDAVSAYPATMNADYGKWSAPPAVGGRVAPFLYDAAFLIREHVGCEPGWCEVASARASGSLVKRFGTSGAFHSYRIDPERTVDELGVSHAG